jgi:phage tail tape-measure protein
MSELRTKIILDMTGNLHEQSRRYGRALDEFGRRGSRSIGLLNRAMAAAGKGIDALGSRYGGFILGAGAVGALRMIGNLEQRF